MICAFRALRKNILCLRARTLSFIESRLVNRRSTSFQPSKPRGRNMQANRTMNASNHTTEQSATMTPTRTEAVTGGTTHPDPISKMSLATLYTLSQATEEEEQKRLSSIKRRKYECLFACAASLLLLTVVSALILLHYKGRLRPSSYCDTTACTNYAAMLTSAIDLKKNPCDNFYSYVCDGWRSEKSVFLVHLHDFLDELTKILEQPAPAHGQNATDKAASFYQSCVRVLKTEQGELESFRRIILQCGIEWPRLSKRPDALRSLIRIVNLFDFANLMVLGTHVQDGVRVLLVFRGLTVGFFYFYRKQIMAYNKYEEYYTQFQDFFKTPGAKEEEFVNYTQFIQMEDKIYDTLMNVSEQQYNRQLSSLSVLAGLTAEISYSRWSELIRTELGLSTNTPVLFLEEDYITAFSRLFSIVGERYVHYEVGWIAMQSFAPYINRKGARIYGGEANDPVMVNFLRCMTATELNLGWAMYARFFASKLDTKTALDISDIEDNIAAATTAKVSFPQENVKPGSDLRSEIDGLLFPQYFRGGFLNTIFAKMSDMGLDLTENWLTAVNESRFKMNETLRVSVRVFFISQLWGATAYTLYNRIRETFMIPPNALVLPVYDVDVTTAVKYGAFGSLLATAALGISKYPSESIAERKCLSESLSDGPRGTAVLSAAASLQIAWNAYRNASRRETNVRLRPLPALSGRHLFFVAACHILCGQSKESEPSRRCNEPLKHHSHFSRVFICPEGSPMNPRKKCELF